MIVVVTGGRDYSDKVAVFRFLDTLGVTHLIHGAARGADTLASEWAAARGVRCTAVPADWGRHGKAAGVLRNEDMLRNYNANAVAAFPGGKGTANCVATAKALGLPVHHSEGSKMTTPNLYGTGLVGPIAPASRGALADRFLMSPFSVWNTREGFWQERRRRWLALGIRSEEGRDDKLTYAIPETLADGSKGRKVEAQTSVFDPVVCELAYKWWSPPGGVVLDPFAGGSVRGIVASLLGRKYYGCELRAEQVAANRAQVLDASLHGRWKPKWVEGDSYDTAPACPHMADMVFSCPPYGNLEVYSDDPRDISNKKYDVFLDRYRAIIARTSTRLAPNSFVVWVVANYRDPDQGKLLDFAGDTIQAWEDAGCKFYNDIILVNSVGSGAMRANTNFVRGGRKVVKLHQNVLVFVKGDHKLAAERCGNAEEIEET